MRDVWALRTWVQTTEPYWTQADHDHYLTKRPLCPACKARGALSRKDACQACAGPLRRGRPAIQRTFRFDAAAKVEEEQEQAVVAGAGAIMSEASAHSATAIDESSGVRPAPRVCAAVHDVLAATAWIGEPPFFPMLYVYEESACEETPATMLSCQDRNSACGDNEILSRQGTLPSRDDGEAPATMLSCHDNASACGDNDIVWWLKSVDVQENACFGAEAEILSRQQTLLTRDDGDLLLQSRDNEEQITL